MTTAVRGTHLTRIDVGVTPAICATESARRPQVGALSAHFQNKQLPELNAGASMEHAHDAGVGSDVISIARCRELLGEDASGLSDQDIDRIRRHGDVMAHVIVEIFLEQRAAQE